MYRYRHNDVPKWYFACTEVVQQKARTEMDLICTEIVMYRKCPPLCTETVMHRKWCNPYRVQNTGTILIAPLFYGCGNVKAIVSEWFTETLCTGVYFLVNGFTENAQAISYFQWRIHWNYEHWALFWRKGKEAYLYSAILVRTHTLKVLRHGSHSFTCKQHHAYLSFISVHQMALPLTEAADIELQLTYSFIDPEGMKGWVGLVGWPIADGLPMDGLSGHPSATGRAQDSESSPAKDRRSTAGPHNHHWVNGSLK